MDKEFNEIIIDHLFEGAYVVNSKRKIIFWNESSERITGYNKGEVANSFCYNNILNHVDENGKKLCFEGCPLHKTLQDGIINEAHVFLKHKDGYRVPVTVKTIPLYNAEQQIVGAMEVFTDERFQKGIYHENIQLKDQLRTDPLTQVSNRQFFDFGLTKRLQEVQIFSKPFGILMIDIDYFKKINDAYGHLVGDEILKMVAKSLFLNVEKTDLVSRWGGEEFVVLAEVENNNDLLKIAERLRLIIAASSYQLDNKETIQATVSIGGTIATKTDTEKTIMKKADENMYFAKQNGRNQSRIL